MKRLGIVAMIVVAAFGVLTSAAYAQCPEFDGKFETDKGWEGTPAPGITVVSASGSQYVVSVAAGYTLSAICVKTGGGENVAGHFTVTPSLPVAGPATVRITSTGVPSSGLSHITFDTSVTTNPPPPPPPGPPPPPPPPGPPPPPPPPGPPPPPPPPGPPAPPPPPGPPAPPPPPGPFLPPAVCDGLSLSRLTAPINRRTTVRARVVDQNGAPMAGVRVTARGAGIRTAARTASNGVARLTLRPRRSGTIVVRAARSTGCVARMSAIGRFRPPAPALTG